VRQCCGQRVHSKSHPQERAPRQFGYKDISGCQPVLDIRSETVPGQSRVFAGLSAGEESRELTAPKRLEVGSSFVEDNAKCSSGLSKSSTAWRSADFSSCWRRASR